LFMRSFLTYGAISLIGIAALYACGDDSGDGTSSTAGTGGQGGSAGAGVGGSSGNANMSGAGGGGGTAGGGAAGAPSIPAANCTQCVQLSVVIPATPVSATNGSQGGYIFSAPPTSPPFDLTNVTTITWRIQALTTNATYFVQPFLQNAPPEDPAYAFGSYPAQVALTPAAFAAGMFVDVPMAITALPGGGGGADAGADGGVDAGDGGVATLTAFDKSKVRTIGLNVGAGPTATAGVVSVELDSVTVAGTSNFTSKTFDTGVEGLALNMYMVPAGTLPPAAH
jgi:hypothetical protein